MGSHLRGFTPLTALLALLALLIALLAGLGSWSQLAGKGTGPASCRLGPLRLELETRPLDNSVEVTYTIQAPNPCYKVKRVQLASVRQDGQTASIELLIDAVGPRPGEVCIQVLPPPVMGKEIISLRTRPTSILVEAHLHLVLGEEAKNYTCTTKIRLPGP